MDNAGFEDRLIMLESTAAILKEDFRKVSHLPATVQRLEPLIVKVAKLETILGTVKESNNSIIDSVNKNTESTNKVLRKLSFVQGAIWVAGGVVGLFSVFKIEILEFIKLSF